MSKIVINNEDQSFETFIKILYDQNILPNVSNLRCKKSPVRTTLGNKYKKV